MAFLALRTFFGLSAVTRSRYATPSSELNSSHTRMGNPAASVSRPYGEVCVTWCGRLVGAIWPPVMP